jgi:hypothetical protein
MEKVSLELFLPVCETAQPQRDFSGRKIHSNQVDVALELEESD